MRLISLNAWGGREWAALSEWLPDCGVDVLCLQEVIRAPEPAPDWLEYIDPNRRLDQRANLYGDVSSLLPWHQPAFAPAARGDLFLDGGAFRSEHGLGMWVSQQLAVVEARSGFVHGDFRPDGWGPEPVPRAIQGQRIWDPKSGKTVLVAHFHGLRDPSGKGGTPTRQAQSRAVVEFLVALRREDEPCVLSGDFNVLPDDPMFDDLAAIGLQDLVTRRGFTDTRTSLYAKPQRFADYMAVSPALRLTGFDVPAHPEVSDHRPLILDFEL